MLERIYDFNLDICDDVKILATALDYETKYCPDDLIFYTNDLALKNIAGLFFGTDSLMSVEVEDDKYS